MAMRASNDGATSGAIDPRMLNDALRSVAECAVALCAGASVSISLDRAPDLLSIAGVDAVLRSDPPGGFTLVEPIVGLDGKPVGQLTLSGSSIGPGPSSVQRMMVRHLSRIAAAILRQHDELVADLRSFREAFARTPSPTWIFDPDSLRFLDVNDAAIRFYGFSREQFLAMTVLDIRPPSERQRMLDAVRNNSDLDAAATWRHCRANGQEVDVITQGRKLTFEGIDAVIAVAIDRTEVQALRKDLSNAQLVLDTIIDALPIGLFLKDMEDAGRYLLYNGSIAEIVGRPTEVVVGRTDIEVFGRSLGSELVRQDIDVMTSGIKRIYEIENVISGNGDVRQVRTVKKPLPTSDGSKPRYLLGISEDITERRKSQDRIAHMALHDALTDLPNRILFKQHLDQMLKRTRRADTLSVFYLDLDFFKTINDTYGHHIGDLLLRTVAARLASTLRNGDMVARLGGDEFAVVARVGGGEREAMVLAERILKTFDAPFELGDCMVHMDTSIGVTLSRAPRQDSSETLMRHADIALYAAKAEGRGVFKIYADRMSLHVEARQMMSEDLRRAVARQEFALDFQPLLDIEGDRITGFEALVRWRHPSRGLVSPGEFIPVAEQTGLIVPIGEWVLREACLNAAQWPDTVKIAVNLSAVQFRKGGLVAMIEQALADTRLSPDRLELEITESVLLTDSGANLQILHGLRALGIRIAMDDFGTGYSSLSYLRSFPFDKIKMDRSFVADVCENDETLAIVRAVTGLGKSLRIRTTAEGIETPEQFARLKAEGFNELQGYLIGRPMSAERAMALAHGAAPSRATAA